MRLVLHPPGLIRLFTKRNEKDPAKRSEGPEVEGYEVTPYGRRPRAKGRRGLKLTAEILAVVVAAVAVVWMLV